MNDLFYIGILKLRDVRRGAGPLLIERFTTRLITYWWEMALEYSTCAIFQRSWLWYWPLSGGCKFRERFLVSKEAALNFDMERFNFVN